MKNIHAFTKKSATVPHKLAFSVLREQHFQGQVSYHGYSPLPFHVSEPAKRRRYLGWNQWENLARFPRNVFQGGKTLPGFRGTFSQAGKPCPVSEEHFPGRENLARFPRNIFQGGKTMLGFRGTFSRAGKACRARGEHFPRQENLAALVGNIFPGGKSLPRCAGTFSQAGKPCRAAQEHFPRRGKLAALRGNIFPSRKTSPRSAGTFSQAGKACRAPRQAFNDNLLAAVFPFSPTSGRTCQAMENAHEKTMGCSPPSFPVRPHQGVCDTPLQFLAKNFHKPMPPITAS